MILLVFGVPQLITGVLILRCSQAGVALGRAMAAANILTQLLVIAYTVWSVVVIVIDGLVVHGVTVHVDDRRRAP